MPRVTISDVAREAEVSAMTVSRVVTSKDGIGDATRARVEGATERLGYRPNRLARALTLQTSQTLGMVVPDINNPFFSEIIRGAEDEAWERGYSLVLGSTAPAALAGMLRVDDAHGAMRAVHHLLGRGRREVGMVAGPERSYSRRHRVAGYTTARETTGREVTPWARSRRAGSWGSRSPTMWRWSAATTSVWRASSPPRSPPCGSTRGCWAVALLLERLAGAPGEVSVTLKPELVVRASAP